MIVASLSLYFSPNLWLTLPQSALSPTNMTNLTPAWAKKKIQCQSLVEVKNKKAAPVVMLIWPPVLFPSGPVIQWCCAAPLDWMIPSVIQSISWKSRASMFSPQTECTGVRHHTFIFKIYNVFETNFASVYCYFLLLCLSSILFIFQPGWEERTHTDGRVFYIDHSKPQSVLSYCVGWNII